MNPAFLIDFYKVGHIDQYPADVTQVWSNFTPRTTRVAGQKHIVWFGLQYFMREILQHEWNEFFSWPLEELLDDYREVINATLGLKNPRTDHIERLWQLGYLPLAIYALPEGVSVPLGVPPLVITNTHPDFAWLPNYFETILSNILWKPCTSATTAQAFRNVFLKYAKASGETDFSFIDWQGHDFSFRGMAGREDAILSGMGHLLSFSGTDTLPAILAAREYYGADLTCGGSVPATEHSVMCAGRKDDEQETFRHLIEDVYPSGIVSIVSDTWDLWKVLTKYVPALKDKILARDGKVVIRPDSGDPVNILCGENQNGRTDPANNGTLRLLAEAVGTTNEHNGLPMINKMAAIYGDSISLERADRILDRTVNELKLSPYNVIFGIGSYTYEYVTRDTYGFAMKATAIRRGKVFGDNQGSGIEGIWKKPVTDDGGKTSLRGIPAVYQREESTESKPDYFVTETLVPSCLDNCAFEKKFENGRILVNETFDEIRKRVRA